MMTIWRRSMCLLVLGIVTMTGICLEAQTSGGAKIPELKGTSFTDKPVNLPQDLQGKTGILVVGYSKNSRDAMTAWGKRLAVDYYDSPGVVYYQMPVLASVPKFVRGYVIGQIKGSITERGKAHFVPVMDHETEWKTLGQYKSGDDAYVMVLDGSGVVRWQTHEAFSEAAYTKMKEHVEALR